MSRKVLFANDGPLYKDSNGDYYGMHLNDSLRERYLHLGENVTFLMRVKKIDDKSDLLNLAKIANDNFDVIEVPDSKSLRNFFRNYIRALIVVKKAVASHDLLVARIPSLTGTMAFRAARTRNIPTLVECVGCTFDAYWNYNWKGRLIAHYKKSQQSKVLENATHAVYVTNHFLQKRYPTKGKSTNCSNVELKNWNSNALLSRKKTIRKKFKSKERLNIGTAAALVPYKGQDDVICTLGVLKEKGYIFNYLIAGKGDNKKLKLLAQKLNVEDQVIFMGKVSHHKMPDYYRMVDIYIQPSKVEGLPRAMIEAMSEACPCLGSNVAGIPELINDKFIFEAGDYKTIAKLLINFDEEKMQQAAQNNFAISKNYQSEKIMSRRLKFFREFLSDHS